mmetsp:Transcript_731/g.1909  ORF Transcript_731/g.1909 Transcript_731/m.1909 type:complete len:90 (+) Transcript_731:851-1120(+)
MASQAMAIITPWTMIHAGITGCVPTAATGLKLGLVFTPTLVAAPAASAGVTSTTSTSETARQQLGVMVARVVGAQPAGAWNTGALTPAT